MKKSTAAALVGATAVVCGAGSAFATTMISGSQIKPGTITIHQLQAALVTYLHHPGPQGIQGVPGAPGLSGYQVVTAQETSAAQYPPALVVDCPDGTRPLGGGGSSTAEGAETITDSEPVAGPASPIPPYPPSTPPYGWQVKFTNFAPAGTGNKIYTAYAVCAKEQ